MDETEKCYICGEDAAPDAAGMCDVCYYEATKPIREAQEADGGGSEGFGGM
jgi:NMD protein affecting ribosome stability and mRNA decay